MLGRIIILMVLSTTIISCEQAQEEEAFDRQEVIENLGDDEHAYFLAPIETVLDDLREIADEDISLMETKRTVDSLGFSGKLITRKLGEDIQKMQLKWNNENTFENHQWYWDRHGVLYYVEAELLVKDRSGEPTSRRAYRFYFEENQNKISAYTRTSFDGAELPKSWSRFSPTMQEERFLLNRVIVGRNL